MGLFDHVRIEDELDIALLGFDGDPTNIDWQTKTFSFPMMDVYKITMNGRLFTENAHYESVPEEERLGNDEVGGEVNEGWQKGWRSRRKIHDGWTDTEYHGILEFHHYADDESYAYEAKFTDGDLVEITRVERFGSQ
jgi:hypothetical protein